MDNSHDHVQTVSLIVGHATATGGIISVLMSWFPPAVAFAASVFALIWYCLQIYESKVVQDWIVHRRAKKVQLNVPYRPHDDSDDIRSV